MRTHRVLLTALFFSVALPGTMEAGVPAGMHPEAAIRLEIEPLLIDSGGIHPLNPPYENLVEVGQGGSFHHNFKLEEEPQRSLVYKLSYRMVEADRIDLTLERSLVREGKSRETMPPLTHRMRVFDLWSPTILEEPGTDRRLVLRVVPIIRPLVEDVPIDSDQFRMWLEGGPLIAFGNGIDEDRIIFRQVNLGGGLQFGIPRVGVAKLSLRKFPGSAPCGRVRGHYLEFELGGREYAAYSVRPILPDDPSRPGRGWILYGSLEASSELRDGYYGSMAQ